MPYKILIVDDEEPARQLLEKYVEKIDDIEVVGVLSHPLEAKKVMNESEVDILLSDIHMEDLTGIELVKMLKNPPVVIFTTAYSEYALESYELDVADYLVKPISFDRFLKSIDKAKEIIEYRKKDLDPGGSRFKIEKDNHYFFVKSSSKMVKVVYDELLFVESFGEYVKLYTQDDVIMAYQRMTFMESMLPTKDFVRIHRSHIVNINHIKEIDKNTVIVNGNHRLVVSKRMRDGLLGEIKKKGLI